MVASADTTHSVIETFRQAAKLAKQSSLRRGNVVEIPAAADADVVVSADLHGHRRNFDRILEIAALDAHPRRHLIMQEVCHGGATYPSGIGCMSHLMLEEVAALKVNYGERFHFLLSNHELAELTDFPIMKAKRMLNLLFRCGLQEMYGEATDDVRDAAMGFIASSPIAIRLGTGAVACHSLPTATDERGFDIEVTSRELAESDLLEGGDVFRWMWGRDYSQSNADAFAKTIGAEVFITGHEPCPQGFQVPNTRQVIIDCWSAPPCYVLIPLEAKPVLAAHVVQHVKYVHPSQAVKGASAANNGSAHTHDGKATATTDE